MDTVPQNQSWTKRESCSSLVRNRDRPPGLLPPRAIYEPSTLSSLIRAINYEAGAALVGLTLVRGEIIISSIAAIQDALTRSQFVTRDVYSCTLLQAPDQDGTRSQTTTFLLLIIIPVPRDLQQPTVDFWGENNHALLHRSLGNRGVPMAHGPEQS
jgi:hypothetical protein